MFYLEHYPTDLKPVALALHRYLNSTRGSFVTIGELGMSAAELIREVELGTKQGRIAVETYRDIISKPFVDKPSKPFEEE